MEIWKQPPIAKVYEALGAIADNRLKEVGPRAMSVASSSGDKFYQVEWGEDFDWVSSNDNASYWQGYIGYPIIAVLLKAGKLTYNSSVAAELKGIAWKELNTKFKNDYSLAIAEILRCLNAKGIDDESISRECERILAELKLLSLKRPGRNKKPPISGKKKKEL